MIGEKDVYVRNHEGILEFFKDSKKILAFADNCSTASFEPFDNSYRKLSNSTAVMPNAPHQTAVDAGSRTRLAALLNIASGSSHTSAG